MSQPPRFFITHSSKDVEFARRLGRDLRASGLGGFLDMYSIQPGDDFVARINAAMPPLLQSRLYINFGRAYLSALWELLEQGFGIDPAKLLRRARMYSGPRLQTGEEAGDQVWWGAYEVLEFSVTDSGKTLRVTVESDHIRTPAIELWRGAFDGEDVATWVEKRVHVTRSSSPLTWNIEPGLYTVYLVDHSVFRHQIRDGPRGYWAYETWPIPDYEITYRIEVLASANGGASDDSVA